MGKHGKHGGHGCAFLPGLFVAWKSMESMDVIICKAWESMEKHGGHGYAFFRGLFVAWKSMESMDVVKIICKAHYRSLS